MKPKLPVGTSPYDAGAVRRKPTPEQINADLRSEISSLKSEVESLKKELQNMKRQLDNIARHTVDGYC